MTCLLLLLQACIVSGRRVQITATVQADDELTVQQLEKKLSDNKFKKIRDLEKKIDKEMQALDKDPTMIKFKKEADQVIDKKMNEIMADPKFKKIAEYQRRADVQSAAYMEQVQKINKSLPRDDQLKELVKIQEEVQEASAKASEELQSLPHFQEFKEYSEKVINEHLTALKEDVLGLSAKEKSKSIEANMKKLFADPHFDEYQSLAALLFQKVMAQETEPGAQSLAQLSQSSTQPAVHDELDQVKSFSRHLPKHSLASAVLDTNGKLWHMRKADLNDKQRSWMQRWH